MKKFYVGSFAVVSVFLLAATGNAANPPAGAPSVQQRPGPPMQALVTLAPFKLVSFTHAPPDADGNFQVDVGVENITGAAKALTVQISGAGTGGTQSAPSVAPHATQHFVFADKDGGPATCGLAQLKEYGIAVGETPSSLTNHHAILHAQGCSFSTQVVNPWNQYTPDHVEAIKKDSLYIDPIQVETQPSCSATMKLKANVTNHTSVAQNGLHVTLKQNGGPVGTTGTFNLAKGASASETFSPAKPINGGAFAVAIEGGGAGTYNAGITVRVNATCNWSTEIDPAAAPPQAIPR